MPGSIPGRRGAVLLRVEGALRFVPASTVLRVAPAPRVTPVPGAPAELLGITTYEGTVVPVIAIGASRREMVVCQHAGEIVGLVGGEVVKTGMFDVAGGEPDALEHEGERARIVDIARPYTQIQNTSRTRPIAGR